MKILSIETSCDETAISIIEATGNLESPSFKILGNALFSQVNTHKQYGGVYPMLAKREHAKNLPVLLKQVLVEASLFNKKNVGYDEKLWEEIKKILSREEGLYQNLKTTIENIEKPEIDLLSVTSGPGLAPALWVGVSCAEALSKLWKIPLIPINHMEGHIASVMMIENKETIKFPALALLISGGHTQLVNIYKWGKYEIMGETMDDAVGEAFDKVARMLGLPYPGGPEISRLAEEAQIKKVPHIAKLPRPMINSSNLNFSFSGLKTSVLYYIRDNFGKEKSLSEEDRMGIAREFEDSVVDVLVNKTKKALDQTGAKTLIVAGGVIANKKIRSVFLELKKDYSELDIRLPTNQMATDNALMIACATYFNIINNPEKIKSEEKLVADGNLKLK